MTWSLKPGQCDLLWMFDVLSDKQRVQYQQQQQHLVHVCQSAMTKISDLFMAKCMWAAASAKFWTLTAREL